MSQEEIELLELIAELRMSGDKSRQALGAEIKRLTDAIRQRTWQWIAVEDRLPETEGDYLRQ